jgi:hypothetical protein
MSFDRRSLKRVALPISVKVVLAGERLAGVTRDISPKGLCLEISTLRVKVSIFGILNTTVTLLYENEIMSGTIRWYTVEEAMYQIGISIDKQSKSTWKKIIDQHMRHGFRGAVKTA